MLLALLCFLLWQSWASGPPDGGRGEGGSRGACLCTLGQGTERWSASAAASVSPCAPCCRPLLAVSVDCSSLPGTYCQPRPPLELLFVASLGVGERVCHRPAGAANGPVCSGRLQLFSSERFRTLRRPAEFLSGRPIGRWASVWPLIPDLQCSICSVSICSIMAENPNTLEPLKAQVPGPQPQQSWSRGLAGAPSDVEALPHGGNRRVSAQLLLAPIS